jgi:adenosine kinase
VTLAEHGCDVYAEGRQARVAGVQASAVVDPTGWGDAFRAALLHGLSQGWSLERCAELGNRLGATKIASRGGQNYTL